MGSTPNIRFKGYTNAWEQRKLKEIADKVTEKNAQLQYVETLTNSAEFGIISQRDFFDHDISNMANLNGYYIVRNEDFVYNPRISVTAPVGPINRNKLGRTGVMSPLYTVFRPHDVDNTYLEYFFKSTYWHAFMNFNGDSGARADRFSIKDSVFFEMPIPTPDIAEQKRIGEFLAILDKTVTLHQRKCDEVKILKKYMLQKMFPQKGQSVPEIRFSGFTDAWEQRKLGELGTVQTCKRIFKEQTSEQGDIPFFKNGTIGLEPDSYISREVYEEFRRLYPYPEVGDTLISVVGSIGRTAEYTGKDEYFQDSNVVWLKTDGSINKKFLKVSYQVIKWLIEGSTVKHLYNDNILRSEITMPHSQIEQAKIAEYFEALDNLITLHQRKCDELAELKKYMLQNMFPKKEG